MANQNLPQIQPDAAAWLGRAQVADAIPCDTCPVRDISICSVLPRQKRAEFASGSHGRRIAKGTVIADEGATMTQVSSVVDGVVKLIKSTSDGRQQIVGLAFPADLVGRPFAENSEFRVETATDVALCSFSRSGFERVLAENPDVEKFMLKAKLDEIDKARAWMLVLGRKSAEERVATLLLMLAEREAKSIRHEGRAPTDVTFELPLTRAEMGDYLGLTLETVSRQFSKLRDAGLISFEDHRDVRVPSIARLAHVAGD